jgi:predicted nucleic acid-binding protein
VAPCTALLTAPVSPNCSASAAIRSSVLDAAAQALLLAGYRSFVTDCERDDVEDYPLPRCRDADDQKFLILGMRCRADLLITRDRRLLQVARQRRLPLPFAIVTASAAGRLIAASQTAAIA